MSLQQAKRKLFTRGLFGLVGLLLCVNPVTESAAQETALLTHIPEKVSPGYTLVPDEGTATVRLLDTEGVTRHTWKVDADRARLLPSCNILVVHGSKWGNKKKKWRALRPVVREYDWNGEIVWEYTASDVAHHDVHRLEDGSTLILKRTVPPESVQYVIKDPTRRLQRIRSDSILRVSPEGEVLWSWHAHEQLDLNVAGTGQFTTYAPKTGPSFPIQDWTHVNTIAPLPDNKWFREGDERFRPGNILVLPRSWSKVLLVDQISKEVVWEYSGDYRGGVMGGHESHMIAEPLPGAGNILMFDNGRGEGGHSGESIVLEINPLTKEIVWKYENGTEFFSESKGSVQRLPNGNTLVSLDRKHEVLEITPEGEIVWHIRNNHVTNRAHRYPIGFCPRLGSDEEFGKEPFNVVSWLSSFWS